MKPEQKTVTISPSGQGVSLKIPQNAQPDKPVNITFKTCLSGSFKYPEGYDPLSSVYHISTSTSFNGDTELSIEHFGNIETKKQAKGMTFLFAPHHGGSDDINFTPVKGGKFEVGKETGTLSTQNFGGYWSAGTNQASEIRTIQFLH